MTEKQKENKLFLVADAWNIGFFLKLHSSWSTQHKNQWGSCFVRSVCTFLGMHCMSGILPQRPCLLRFFAIYGTELQCLGQRTQALGMNAICFRSCLSLLETHSVHLGNIYWNAKGRGNWFTPWTWNGKKGFGGGGFLWRFFVSAVVLFWSSPKWMHTTYNEK